MGSPDKSPAHSYCAPKHILREGGPQSALTRGGGGGHEWDTAHTLEPDVILSPLARDA